MHAAGLIFVAPDGAILLLLRSPQEKNYSGHWALPGGGGDEGETPLQTAVRECAEEIGATEHAWQGEPTLVDAVETPTGMVFSTFLQPTKFRFVPELNYEHSGYAWVMPDALPTPVHPAVLTTLAKAFPEVTGKSRNLAEDDASGKLNEKERAEADKTHSEREEMPPEAFLEPGERKYPVKTKGANGWSYSRDLLLAAAREARMHGHEDLAKRADAIRNREFAQDAVALDKGSVRRRDQDGHLFVELTPISKANVCPYYGREIPDAQALGLDPDRIYNLYRDPTELAAAAPTFAGKQLLIEHIPVSADDPQRSKTVGSIGDDVVFRAPYLMAPLSVWDGEAIALIDSGAQKQLSSAYRYRADMTPGIADGEPYDGVMRDIAGNHVALVAAGRAGPDVVVQDAALEQDGHAGPAGSISIGENMKRSLMAATAHGALLTYLKPKLAQDAKLDLSPVLDGVTSKTFDPKKMAADVKKAVSGKLAKDQKIDDLDKVLLALDEAKPDDEEKKAEDEEDPKARLKAFLKGKLSEDDMKACDEMVDDLDGQEAMDEEKDDSDKVTKEAMDAAITSAVKNATENTLRTQREIREAEEVVRPYVGRLAMAHDSAPAVYRTALGVLGVKGVDALHPDALKPILLAQPLPGAKQQERAVAMDAAGVNSFYERFPEAKAHQVRTI